MSIKFQQMPYQYDVFISYKRGKISEQWLEEIFLPMFTDYLDNELPYKPKIFVDKSELSPGVDFNEELFIKLLYSKCIVSIWSPPYFRRSEWCMKEFLTMKHRQEHWQLGTLTQPKTLIWPVIYREVDPIPPIAKNMTVLNYSDFNVVGEAFFKTEKYLDFQKKLEKDIKTIAEIVKTAKPLNPEWETEEGKEKILEELNEYFEKAQGISEEIKQDLITW